MNTGMTNTENNTDNATKAIAIKGGDGNTSAPKIIAKGEGLLAEKLLDIAFAEGVKVRKDKDLTELLSAFDVESPIPLEALHTVSLILERVYAENKKMDTDATDDAVPPAQQSNQPTFDGATGQPLPMSEINKGPAS